MDPIESITISKDSSFAMMLEAQRRQHTIFYMQQQDLFVRDGTACAQAHRIVVEDNKTRWFTVVDTQEITLSDLDLLLMRKDPPVDDAYIHATHILSLAETQGVKVVNNPQALRDVNEKLFITSFPECIPPTLVTSQISRLKSFIEKQEQAVVKPLNNKGGEGVMRLSENDPNTNAVLALLTHSGKTAIMAQRFIPEIVQGDKRILLINGDPVPYALVRLPGKKDWRGNLAAGATYKAQPLTQRDHWICKQVGPVLRKKGLAFVGMDVIGDYLTEINVTSPTCIRELDATGGITIAGQFLEAVSQ